MDFIDLRRALIEKDFGAMNDKQFEAVTTVNGPLLVLAGAGSGKTTVLINRIANLVKYGNAYNSSFIPYHTEADIDCAERYLKGESEQLPEYVFSVDAPRPWEILAITFTNKAAGELRERINAKLGAGGEDIWAGTFHSVCGRFLRRFAERIGFTSHFTIYDTDDQRRLMKEIMKQLSIDEKFLPHRFVLSSISSAKDELVSPDEYERTAGSDPRQKMIAQLYRAYQERLAGANAMDFDDMIVQTIRLFKENPDVLSYYGEKFRYIMVDEYQDTNHAQYVLVSLLASVHGNLCVVGDDDQSIYRFRGATIENILNFEEEFKGARTIKLEQNYRSTNIILDAANAVIKHNVGRKGKNLWTAQEGGELIDVYTAPDQSEEARYVAEKILKDVRNGAKFSDNAILYRMNAQSASLENAMMRSGISYKIVGGFRFFERKEIRDVLAYLSLINNNDDEIRLRRVINEPKRGIGETTINNASQISSSLGVSLFEVISQAQDYPTLSRASAKLIEFSKIIKELTELSQQLTLSELFEKVLEKTGYRNALVIEATEEAHDRLENVKELASNIKQYETEAEEPSLSEFLEQVSLFSDIDSLDADEDRVVLMTIHSSKGLEFNNVYLVGMEEGIFPGTQSVYGGHAEIEEERRLAYVAITRAKKKLTITNATCRLLFGSTTRNLPSRFLKEVPAELCETYSPTPSYKNNWQQQTSWSASQNEYSLDYRSNQTSRTPSFGTCSSKPASQKSNTTTKPDSYRAGQVVEHNTFGKGIIRSVTAMAGDMLLEIAFERVGVKKLMATYAKLKLL